MANNSGGPHCLLHGVTTAHVLALEVVLPDGSVAMLGGLEADPPGYDLRGAFVGSEGTMGIATRIAVRLTPLPPAVVTMLADFTTVEAAAATVSGIIAAGIVPAALEMMDARITAAVEAYVHAGFPTDAAAVLLVEVDGLPAGVAAAADAVGAIARDHGARTVRVAADAAERALLWKGRKSAFGAVARIAPNYYLHDTVVPRTRLVEVLAQVYEIAERVRPGDGQRLPRRRRQPAPADRLRQARARGSWTGSWPPARPSSRPAWPPAACCRASTASAWRSATTWAWSSPTTTWPPRPGCGTPSIPTAGATRGRCCRPAPGAATSSSCRPGRGCEPGGVGLGESGRLDPVLVDFAADGRRRRPGVRRSAAGPNGTSAGRPRPASARWPPRPGW